MSVSAQGRAKFNELCERLKRNDPAETSVCAAGRGIPLGYGRDLSFALSKNIVVTEIKFDLSKFLSKMEQKAGTVKAVAPLLQWIEGSPSLKKVVFARDFVIGESVKRLLLQSILNAMASNPPGIRSLECDREKESDSDYEAEAQAIGALPALKAFHHSGTDPVEILQALCGHAELRELSIDFGESRYVGRRGQGPSIDGLCGVLHTVSKLQRVTLKDIHFYANGWKAVSSGLQSNPSIVDLNLVECRFTKKATPLFLQDMQSNAASHQQHIRRLHLVQGMFVPEPFQRRRTIGDGMYLGKMLSGSLLQHITVDNRTMRNIPSFCEALSSEASTVRLRSLQLNGFQWRQLRSLSAYLAQTVHLRRLTIDSLIGETFPVPSSFLHCLRRNGSLHHVEIRDPQRSDLIRESTAYRFISAFTARNRLLPDMLAASMHRSEDENDDAAGSRTRSGSCRNAVQSEAVSPTLVQVGHPASRFAPNTLLRGLLSAAADSDHTSPFGGRTIGGKRILDFSFE